MLAIKIDRFGGPEVLRLQEVDDPTPRPDDLLVRVRAAGVNRADIGVREGHYGWADFGDSHLIGLEMAGEVVGLGAAVRGFEVGDRVMGVTGGGAYAQLARLDHRMAMPVPPGLDWAQAAGVPEAFVTAHEALFHLGELRQGQSALIHAASGGIGSAAVQLAKQGGASVIFTASGNRIADVRALGGDVGVDYRHEDFDDAVARATAGRGVDVIMDFIGAPYLERNVLALAEGGRLIQVGLMSGTAEGRLPLDVVLLRYLRIIGTVMKSRTQDEKHAMTRRFRERWLTDFESGALRPVIDSVFPLAEAAQAHRRMEAGNGLGKIILSVD